MFARSLFSASPVAPRRQVQVSLFEIHEDDRSPKLVEARVSEDGPTFVSQDGGRSWSTEDLGRFTAL
ncbi:MAG: hypothetical protein Q8Q09_15190 [Deltaproteobacteria bacterium]|nr:hypothetical protein [Deltaproteobacteria bacterium]